MIRRTQRDLSQLQLTPPKTPPPTLAGLGLVTRAGVTSTPDAPAWWLDEDEVTPIGSPVQLELFGTAGPGPVNSFVGGAGVTA